MAVKRIKIGGVAYDINDPRLGGIDDELSGLSTNPLQNDVITAEFAKTSYIGDTVEDVDDIPEEPEEEYTIIIGGDGEENVIDAITFNGTAVPVTNKIAAITVTIPSVPDISTSISSDASSDVKTASPKAVKDYVDGIVGNLETLLAAI